MSDFWAGKSYGEQRYERLVESLDEYVSDDDAPDLIAEIRKGLAEIKEHPLKQVKKITKLQEFFDSKPSTNFIVED
jgi:hypothetical protein